MNMTLKKVGKFIPIIGVILFIYIIIGIGIEKIGNNAFSNYNWESFFLIKSKLIKKDILMHYCERF